MELQLETTPLPIRETKREREMTLSKRGYTIRKEQVGDLMCHRIRQKLMVKPNININYEPDSKPFPVYLESKHKLYVPKFFGLAEFGPPNKNTTSLGDKIDLEFKGTLRETQQKVIDLYLDSCQVLDGPPSINCDTQIDYTKSNGGIISVGCGFGKTVLGLYLAQYLSRKTLVIVHKEFLMTQWKDRIEQYLPSARVGRIQGSRVEVNDKDIVIAMLQSVSMKDYPVDIFNSFGLCIIDECHHIGAEVFSRSLPKINSWFMLGLSATPKRKDGLSKVFEWYLGPYIYRSREKNKRELDVKMIYYDSLDPLYNKVELTIKRKPSVPRMITNISVCPDRNKLIVDLLLHICENIGRKVLVLGERREQLFTLRKQLEIKNMKNVGYYIGGLKEDELKRSETCQILLATYSMSSEGMDIPSLNTLFMISSKADIEQSVGRILRREHNEIRPEVYDLVDNFSVLGNQGRKRLKFYQKNGYCVYTSQARDIDVDSKTLLVKATTFTPMSHPRVGMKSEIKKGECLL